ncbi:MAG: PDZ domain-containing protein [Planctomycetes bacterium]|nr:PDZ domain-containing protein [Planctomycetota bacterium]
MKQRILSFILGLMAGTVATTGFFAFAGGSRPGAPAPAPSGGNAGASVRSAGAADASSHADDPAALRQALEKRAAENRTLSDELSRARKALAKLGAKGPAAAAASASGQADADLPTAAPAAPDAEELRRQAAELSARIPELLAGHDGVGLLSILRKLAELGEAGFAAAADLAAKIVEDMRGEGKLRLDYRALLRTLSSEKMVPLLKFAISHDDGNASFRRLAVESLAWSDDPEVVTLLAERFGSEKNDRVAGEMASVLSNRHEPAATEALLAAFRTKTDRPDLRHTVLEALWDSDNPEVDRLVQDARYSDADPKVRELANLMALYRDPPAPGYLVTQIYPDSQASRLGLQSGDLIVRYNDVEISTGRTLGEETRKAGKDGDAVMVVVRQGRTMELRLKGSTIGIDGQVVKPKR